MCLRWWWRTRTWTHGDLCLIFHTLQGFTILTNRPWDAVFCLPVIKKKVCTEQKQGNDESLQADVCVCVRSKSPQIRLTLQNLFSSSLFLSFLTGVMWKGNVFSVCCVWLLNGVVLKVEVIQKLGRGSGHPMCRAWYDVRDVGGDRMRQETNSLYIKKNKKERKCIIKIQ